MKNKNHKFLLAVILVISISHLVSIQSFLPRANAQGAGDAYFAGVGHSLKVYEYSQDNWNFTIYNLNCEVDIWGRAWFFFRFYLDNVLWWDEQVQASTWQLNKGQSTTRFYTVNLGSGPATKNVKIELYWDYEGTPYLQDTTYFSEQVVKLFVDSWSPSSPTVEKGKITATPLSISLKNGGNDYMYSVSVSVIDSAGLTISPDAQNLQDIASQGTKSTSFSVTAPLTAALGTKTVYFQVSYSDFREVAHTETKTASVTVVKLSTTISLTIQPSSLKRGASTTITAKLSDGNNVAVTGKEISFSIGAISLDTAITDSSGNAIKTYTANLDAGTYSVQTSYAGSADYGACSSTGNLIVIPLDTAQIINAPSVKVGTAAAITATLKDENENPIPDVNIDFYIFENNAWSKISSATTNAVGQASITRTFNSSGEYQIKTVYAGSVNYNKVNATATLTVSQFPTTLTLETPSATQGKECCLKATLEDENGIHLQNIDVDFYILEQNTWKKIGSARTDSNGIASLMYTPTVVGTLKAKATCSGALNYAGANSESIDLEVTMDYTPYYIGGGIIAIAAISIAGYIIFRRRKKTPSTAKQTS